MRAIKRRYWLSIVFGLGRALFCVEVVASENSATEDHSKETRAEEKAKALEQVPCPNSLIKYSLDQDRHGTSFLWKKLI